MNKRLWKRRISVFAQGFSAALVVGSALTLIILSCTREPAQSPLRPPVGLQAEAEGCIVWDELPGGVLHVRCQEDDNKFRLYLDLQVRNPSGVIQERTDETAIYSEEVTPTAPISVTVNMDGLTELGEVWARARWARPGDLGIVGSMSCGLDEQDAGGFVLCRPLFQYYFPSVIAVVE